MSLLPRSVAESLVQLRRDATMVARTLAGHHAPPFRTRSFVAKYDDHQATDAVRALLAPRTLRIARVVRETKDAVSLVLEDPSGAPVPFTAGQFFTLLVPIGDEVLRRAYSASSDVADTSRVAVTVKRIAGGLVSNHLNEHAREGDLIQVLGPSGNFTVEPAADRARTLVLLAGGSGITPMMAIARAVLAKEPRSRVFLVYGNRGEADVIFKSAIDELARAHEGRFVARHVLSDPPAGWKGAVGVLEERVVRAELDAIGDVTDAEYFLCGPEPMMRAARAAVEARSVPAARIHEERFTQPHLRARTVTDDAATPQLLTLRYNGSSREVYVAPTQTVLEAGIGTGVKMPYSCTMGGCAACKVKLEAGEVEMEEPNCLTAEERAEGYVLACVSRLKTPCTVRVVPVSPREAAGTEEKK